MNILKQLGIGIAVLAALAGIGWQIYSMTKGSAAPVFSFEQSKGSDWWGSENVNIQAMARSTDYNGEEPIERLPVADLTVHHAKPGSANMPPDNCFIMHSYYDYSLGDVAAAHKNYINRKEDSGTVKKLGSLEQRFTTPEGERNYTLEQYRFTTENKDALQGYQVGFIPLEAGYIRIEGVCKSSDDLKLTLPILSSVQLRNP